MTRRQIQTGALVRILLTDGRVYMHVVREIVGNRVKFARNRHTAVICTLPVDYVLQHAELLAAPTPVGQADR